MTEQASSGRDDLTPSLVHLLEQVCDQFEAAWKTASTGQRPRIADYLGDAPEPERSALLRELIALDIAYRRQAGEQEVASIRYLRLGGAGQDQGASRAIWLRPAIDARRAIEVAGALGTAGGLDLVAEDIAEHESGAGNHKKDEADAELSHERAPAGISEWEGAGASRRPRRGRWRSW